MRGYLLSALRLMIETKIARKESVMVSGTPSGKNLRPSAFRKNASYIVFWFLIGRFYLLLVGVVVTFESSGEVSDAVNKCLVWVTILRQ